MDLMLIMGRSNVPNTPRIVYPTNLPEKNKCGTLLKVGYNIRADKKLSARLD